MLSLQVFEVTSSGQAEEGVKFMTIHVEGGHTSGCCNTELTLKEKSQTVDEV
jgi:hypothetical protein